MSRGLLLKKGVSEAEIRKQLLESVEVEIVMTEEERKTFLQNLEEELITSREEFFEE